MIHLVFDFNATAMLREAMAQDETLAGDILVFNDDLSVGPVQELLSDIGVEYRQQWWTDVLAGGDFEGFSATIAEDKAKMVGLIDTLNQNEAETVWIWVAQNARDVSGYYWLLPYLKPYQGRVHILFLNNLPFINDKGAVFYPVQLSEIPAREFLKAQKLARPITLSELEVDPDEWEKLSRQPGEIRVLEGGKKLVQQTDESLLADLKKYIMPDAQKASRILHNFMNKSRHRVPEAYVLWKLKSLAASGQYEVSGKIEKMKDFDLKYKSKTVEETA
jgi:hypothetical protein